MKEIIPGTIVVISNLSKASYYLYRSFLKYNSNIICPCKLKRQIPLIVEDIFNGNIVLLKGKKHNLVTMTYIQDLEAVYERT